MIRITIATLGLIDDDRIELDLAALALSELDHPETDLSPHFALLDEMSERLLILGASATSPLERARALATMLNGEFGFAGDIASYDAPLNGDLIRVLERRRGLPVSLSILYVAAARRVGWPAYPLNTPGHMLVQICGEEPVIVDPFNGGALIDETAYQALLDRAIQSGADIAPDRIGPLANRGTLLRLLMNQASRAEASGDPGRAMTIYHRMTLVAPDNPDGWWSFARLQIGAGMIEQARRSLTAMLEITRDPERRTMIASVLEQITQN